MNPAVGLNFDFITHNCFVFSSGTDIRFCNRVCSQAIPTDNEISEIKLFFKDKPFTWVVDSTDTESIQNLQKNNLHYKIYLTAMILNLNLEAFNSYSVEICIKEIDLDGPEVNDWLFIVSKSFNVSESELSKPLALFKQRTSKFLKLYLGFYQNKPVTASMSIRHQQIVSFHLISTLPEFRNKGLGFAITNKMLFDAKKLGCNQAILIASQLGKRIYERIGFKEYALYDVYGNY